MMPREMGQHTRDPGRTVQEGVSVGGVGGVGALSTLSGITTMA